MQILGTGLSGLVGSRIVDLLSSKYTFVDLSRKTGVDITDKKQVEDAVSHSDSSVVLHFAAKADVDGCEKDKQLGQNGEAWRINVKGTENVISACKKTKKKIIYISTDFVFDGKIQEGQKYSEEDSPNPINWYAQTKYEAEKLVLVSNMPLVILRIAYPYRTEFVKKEYVRNMISFLKNGQHIRAVADHFFTPTFVDDLSEVIDTCILRDTVGIYHAVGAESVSPYDVAIQIAKAFSFNISLIKKTTREEFFKGRAKRPFNTSLKNDKIVQLGIRMHSFADGLKEVKKNYL